MHGDEMRRGEKKRMVDLDDGKYSWLFGNTGYTTLTLREDLLLSGRGL